MGSHGTWRDMEDSQEWDFAPHYPHINPTVVLVGRTGNGKSATGNSILGRPAFKSKRSFSSVTETSELQESTLPDGRRIRIIDTPGVFDPSTPLEFIGKEIARCIDLAKEGVHAVVLVLSTRNRFTNEELAATESLQAMFGPEIVKHMIVLFTGGDELAEDYEELDHYLKDNAPPTLLELLKQCGGRQVLFDNKTKEQYKKNYQLNALLDIVDKVIAENDGQPYSNELFNRNAFQVSHGREPTSSQGNQQEEIARWKEAMEKAHAEHLQYATNLLEEKLRAYTEQLEERLNKERLAREEIERCAREARDKSEADIKKLKDELLKASREREEFMKKYNESARKPCIIL